MGSLVDLVTPLHTRTSRDYLARMAMEPIDGKPGKVHCMEKSREYGKDYWDGDRRYGYGGYRYDGRWKPLAEQIIARYGLTNASRVLDMGCGKAHLLHEIKLLLPEIHVQGVDCSWHGLDDAPAAIRSHLMFGHAQQPWAFADSSFDLVLSVLCFHNLKRYELPIALKEMQRVGKQGYICVESYRNAQEQFNLQCWALTCWAFYDTDEWISAFKEYGYDGDYEFIYFE